MKNGLRRRAGLLVAAVFGLGVAVPASLASNAVASTVPQAWHVVSYDGVVIEVPVAWPVVNLAADPSACVRLDVHAVYLGTSGTSPSCPVAGVGAKTEAVQIAPATAENPDVLAATKTVTIDGQTARTNPDTAVTRTVTDIIGDVKVNLSYGSDRALITRIQSTLTVTATARTALPAAAPATVSPAATVQGVVSGGGFDACSAPSTGVMRDWLASSYRSVGVYIGGADEACAQPYLTSSWVSTVEGQGWHIFPLYPGLQAPCVNATGDAAFSASDAAAEGRSSAEDAVTQARDLGFPLGTPLIYDMEAYSGCGPAVITFLNAWDSELNAEGYSSGVYESFSNVSDLVDANGSMDEPQVIDYAAWDGEATTDSSYMPPDMWTDHQRIHQYAGAHDETWGGDTIDIDSNQLDVNLSGFELRPTAVVDRSGVVRVYVRGSSGSLWEDHLNSGSTWSWTDLGGTWTADPAVAVGADGTVRVYEVGTSGNLYEKDLPKGGTWSGWADMGGSWPYSPATTVGADGTVRVYEVSTSGSLYEKNLPSGGSWSGWNDLGGSGLQGTPAAVTGPSGVVRVYARGSGGAVAEDHLNPGSTWSWTNLGGQWPYDPAAVVGADGTVRVYGIGSSGHLYEKRLPAGGAWSGWNDLGGTAGVGTPAAVVSTGGVIRVYARLSGGGLWEDHLDPGSTWSWTSLGGNWPADPAAAVGADGTIRVYGTGFTGDLYEKHLPPAGAWSGWNNFGAK